MNLENRRRTADTARVSLSNGEIDEALSLAELISLTKDACDKARQKELNRIRLHARWGAILWAIHSLGNDATLVKIAQLTARRRHTMSHMLLKLEHAEMVRRIRDLDRKNWVRAVLTEKGNDIFEKLSDRKSVKKMISVLSPSDQVQMIRYLERLYKKATKFLGINYVSIAPFPDEPHFYLFRLIINTEEVIVQAKEKELLGHKLGIRYDAVLSAIENIGDNALPSGIARYLQRRCNSITHMLSKMAEDGLIKYMKHPKLQKRKVVVMTQLGHQKYLASRSGTIVPEIILSLSRENRRRLKIYLKTVHAAALEQIAG
jgi:DNA-binding MarR family transcriptional regulator